MVLREKSDSGNKQGVWGEGKEGGFDQNTLYACVKKLIEYALPSKEVNVLPKIQVIKQKVHF